MISGTVANYLLLHVYYNIFNKSFDKSHDFCYVTIYTIYINRKQIQ